MRVNKFSQTGNDSVANQQTINATMTGPLVLAGSPTSPLEAIPKQYVDSTVNSLNASNIKTGVLSVARLPAFTGDASSATGSGSFILANTGITAGNYTKVTVDSKGRILAGSNITINDIPPFSWGKVSAGKPTTIDGYGITDALKTGGATVTGSLSVNVDPTSALHAATKQYVDGLGGGGVTIATGNIVRRMSNVTPTGFLRCNGGAVDKTTYSALYTAVKAPFLNTVTLDYTNSVAVGAGQPWCQQYDFNFTANTNISSWATTGAAIGTLSESAVVVTKNRVYMLGGFLNNAVSKAVYFSNINADGSLNGWSAGTNLPVASYWHTALVVKNKVYIFGVMEGASAYYSAPLNADGSLGTWVNAGNLPMSLVRSAGIVTKSKVYLFGGLDGNMNATNKVYSANIDSSGNLSGWVASTSLPSNVSSCAAIVTKNRVYLVSCSPDGSSASANVYTTTIDSTGTIGAWSTTTGPLTIQSRVIVTKNRVFMLCGKSSNQTFTAPINSDGTLGTWDYGTNLPDTLYRSTAFAVKDKVYLIGGYDNGGFTYTSYVGTLTNANGLTNYSAFWNGTINKFDGSDVTGAITIDDKSINSTSVGEPGRGRPWQQQYEFNEYQESSTLSFAPTSTFPVVRYQSTNIVTKNKVYIIGGTDGSTSNGTNTIYSTSINTDGTIGSWVMESTFPINIYTAASVVIKNRVYVFGGRSNAVSIDSIYSTTINYDGSLNSWSLVGTLPAPNTFSSAVFTYNRVYLIGGSTDSNVGSVVYSVVINSDGTIGATTRAGYLPTFVYNVQIAVVKNYIYVIGGLNPNLGTAVNTVYRTTIAADGTIGAWSTYTGFADTSSDGQVLITKNRAYVIGGTNNQGYHNYIYSSTISSTGDFDGWSVYASISESYAYASLFVTSTKVYLLAGSNTAGGKSVHSANYNGGYNDYSYFYESIINTADTTNFNLPDLTSSETSNEYYFIKY